MPPTEKLPKVSLADDVTTSILDTNIALLLGTPDTLWPYPQTSMRAPMEWVHAYRMRNVIADLFEASGGHLLHQAVLAKQVSSFLETHGASWAPRQVAERCYTMRTSMSNLKYAKCREGGGRCRKGSSCWRPSCT